MALSQLHPLLPATLQRNNSVRGFGVLSRKAGRTMARRMILGIGVAILVTMTLPVQAGPGGMHGVSGHGGNGGGNHGAFSGHSGPFFVGFGVGGGGFYYAYSPFLVMGPGGFVPPFPAMMPPFMPTQGPLLPPPIPGMFVPQPRANVRPANFRHGDPVRAGQLITLGDRLFRAGNLKKAEDRFQQAARTAPDLAGPRVRLAQVALARGNYTVPPTGCATRRPRSPAGSSPHRTSSPFTASRPNSAAAWRASSRTSKSTPTTAMRGWSWAPSGS